MSRDTAGICSELREIGKLISSVSLIMAVRREVAKVMKEGFVVTDGRHQPEASKYEVAVRCGKQGEEVTRRLKARYPDMEVDRIAEGVLGIRTARRGNIHACGSR